jgi:hypothetical protein
MKTIKQEAGSQYCVACVAAMAAGVPLEMAFSRMQPSRGEGALWYTVPSALRFLLDFDIQPAGVWNLGDEGQALTSACSVRMEWSFTDGPALVTVRSETREGEFHFVFWDGECVRDPNPGVADERSLSDYKVVDVTPLTYPE